MAKILVVDDEQTNRLLVATLLNYAGHAVVEAATAAEGLERTLHDRPDLLLVDLSLPDLSGAELIRRLRAQPETAGVAVVLYTASPIDGATRDFMEMYAVRSAIQKPSIPEEFLRVVESALQAT